jgi:hypothetical protein
MLRKLFLMALAATAVTVFSAKSAEAQLYQKFYVTPRSTPAYVPHTSTHYHYVPHGNHVHAVPHTTTHYHRVQGYGGYGQGYGIGYGHNYGYGTGYGSGYGQGYGYGSQYRAGYGNNYHNHHNSSWRYGCDY